MILVNRQLAYSESIYTLTFYKLPPLMLIHSMYLLDALCYQLDKRMELD